MTPEEYKHITSNATTSIKALPGILRRIVINKAGASSNTATVYDSSDTSGNVIAVIDTTTARTIEFGVRCETGLCVVTGTGTAGDLTVVFE